MVESQVCSPSRLLFAILASLSFVFLCNSFFNLSHFGVAVDFIDLNPSGRIKVHLEHHVGSSPPIISAVVTNTNRYPISILKYESPLDDAVLQAGLLEILPAGSEEPILIPQAQFRRVWPPTYEQLVTLEPGESSVNQIILRPHIISPSRLKGEATVELKGEWLAVWTRRKEDIDPASLQSPRTSSDSYFGDYTTGKVEMEF